MCVVGIDSVHSNERRTQNSELLTTLCVRGLLGVGHIARGLAVRVPSSAFRTHCERSSLDFIVHLRKIIFCYLASSKKRRKYWVHPINELRERDGEFFTLFPKLLQDEERFYMYFRMSIQCFNELYDMLNNYIQKADTNFRRAISAKERLVIFLRFIATGDNYKTIAYSYRIGYSTVAKIIKEVSQAVWSVLQPICMPLPTETTWKECEQEFRVRWGFPNCIGAIDGKHVYIKCPKNSGSLHFCYKERFSIVLLAVVDPYYKFTMIDVGSYGKDSDSTIFQKSSFYQRLINNQLNIPEPKPLPEKERPIPHVFLGDGGFKLEKFLMRPFSTVIAARDQRKRKYNKRLSSARRIVESTFGILAHKWRLFLSVIELDVNTTVDIVKAACCLHNYLIINKQDNVVRDNDEIMNACQNVRALGSLSLNRDRTNLSAYAVREEFISYFNSL
ncbi:hypothetical protein evm_004140 [Chilo suppressalis]|nr:hypothetical protein evm_004140 [Chilo suppressalis]